MFSWCRRPVGCWGASLAYDGEKPLDEHLARKVVTHDHTYWLEYRQPLGADSFLSQYPGATDGVLIHVDSPVGGTDLLDMRPDTAGDFSDAALPAGASWTTPEGAVIRVESATRKGATVRVKVPATSRR